MRTPVPVTLALLGTLSLLLLATTPRWSTAQCGTGQETGSGALQPAPMEDGSARSTVARHYAWLELGWFLPALEVQRIIPLGAWASLPHMSSAAAGAIETPAWRPRMPALGINRRAVGATR